MADLNAWTDRQKARTLREVRAEVGVLRAACEKRDNKHPQLNAGQRRMATRIEQLLDAKIAKLEGQGS